jgi:hypothetical protein
MGVTRVQMLLEPLVASAPAPSISADAGDDGRVTLSINYADAATGQTSLLTFNP